MKCCFWLEHCKKRGSYYVNPLTIKYIYKIITIGLVQLFNDAAVFLDLSVLQTGDSDMH